MRYLCTRGSKAVSPSGAIVQGLSPKGGLYVPESFPQVDPASLDGSYKNTASRIISLFLTDSDPEKIGEIVKAAYRSFDTDAVAPVVDFSETESVLELFHGPTMAFKDVALQILPYLMRNALDITGEKREVFILVATSGDTGKAALEGFKDVPGTRVLVFYPHGGVSEMQRLQMATQEGANVDVCAIRGNFDDAQTGVKNIFNSEDMAAALSERGRILSSANSINFGRLLPQIVYYFTAYKSLVDTGKIQQGDKVNFCVPTGNFGDILAGYYAKRMGLPVNKLICASNRNNVLTDFFRTGEYNKKRTFYKDMSCSIDILISSNLERLLFEVSGRNPETVSAWMDSLKNIGAYRIDGEMQKALSEEFYADWCTEENTLDTIARVFKEKGYLMDPHTAVAQTVYERYRDDTGDKTHTVVLSTASPYKFSTAVLSAFETPENDDFKNADRLHAVSGVAVPDGVGKLLNKKELHTDICEIVEMPARVLK